MAMATLLVLTALVPMSLASEIDDLPILPTPTNLAVGVKNYTCAVARWDYDVPANVSASLLRFWLLVDYDEGPTQTFHSRPISTSNTYSMEMTDLLPDRNYTLRIKATAPGWQESSTAKMTFAIPREGYPAPLIEDVSSSRRDDYVEYTVKWSVSPLSPLLAGFELQVCGVQEKSREPPQCSKYRLARSETSARFPIYYNTEFTIVVIAGYMIPVVGQIEKFSRPFNGNTRTGSPGRILKMDKVDKVGEKIQLPWHPPLPRGGPTSFYEVFVTEPSLKPGWNLSPQVVSDGASVSLGQAEMDGRIYEMRFMTDDSRCMASMPLQLKVLERTRRAVRFRLYFQKTNDISDYGVNNKRLHMGPGVAEAFGFPAYTTLYYRIRSCLTYEGKPYEVCGNFSGIDSLSNTAAPSAVEDLDYVFVNVSTVAITWKTPEFPNGPIDGYKLKIQRSRAAIDTQEIILEPSQRWFVIHKFSSKRQYVVKVAAFNYDAESGYAMLVGPWDFVIPTDRDGAIAMLTFMTCAFLVFIAVGIWFENR